MKHSPIRYFTIVLLSAVQSFGQTNDIQQPSTDDRQNQNPVEISQTLTEENAPSVQMGKTAIPAAREIATTSSLPDSTAGNRGILSRIQATIGVEGFLVMQGKDKQMTDEINGLGMSKGLGFSVWGDYRLSKWIALSLHVGFSQWTIEKRYLSEGQLRYESSEKMGSIPLSLGAKVYLPKVNGLYVLPEVGVSFISVKTTTSDTYPLPSLNIKDSNTPLQFGGNIGYEIRKGKLLIDVSARYQVTQIKSNLSSFNSRLNQPYQFAGIRIGVGI